MPIDTNRIESCPPASKQALADAIRSWHRNETLTPIQVHMIELARMETYARALGVEL